MMSTPPDDILADDDLDITAKLPILSSADIVDAPPEVDDATGKYRTQLDATAALHVEAGGHWDLSHELVEVRDRIVSLEAALADSEIKLTQLHARHDSLQSHHADLLIHSQAVSRDRDRLAEESLLWLASRQQLQDQLEQQRQHGEALQTELLTAQQQFAEQHASAAALARSMAQAMREKDDVQHSLVAREQRIAELQRDLTLADERIEHLVSQVETEESHWRSAEQDKERLCQTVATERETLENTRRELSERQAEIGTLQDELNRAAIGNDQLGQQLAERNASLNARQEVIASQDRELLALQEAQAALVQREATLLDSVTRLRVELGQVQSQLQESDKLALDQARELEGVNSTNQELTEQIRHRDQTLVVQAERIAELSEAVQRLQDELAAKHLEQGASARQVEALQVELHQHVEAMQAIRRDIHQVALQTRKSEGGTLLRTLTRDDADGVVHLLNKSSISIGRGHECDIRLRSSSVSRYHAVLRISHDAVILEDMNSTNGCYVNGRRITRQLLKDGDRLKVGAVPLRFGIRAMQD
jgi:chromosome segregation ATPase